MLVEDPGLLYAELEGDASAPREALAAAQHEITDYLAREELRRLEEGTVPHEHLYGVIHDLGEVAHFTTGYPLAEQLLAVAEPVVVRFLRHEDPLLRYIALNVLGLHWNLRASRGIFASMMFEDSDTEVRRVAAACLGFVLEQTRDWKATETLLRKFRQRNEDPSVRATA